MEFCEAKRKAVLIQIIADRDFATESIAPSFQAELPEIIGISLNKDGDVKG
jgi:hypothetical protein